MNELYLESVDDLVLSQRGIPPAQMTNASDRYNTEIQRRGGSTVSQFMGAAYAPSVYSIIFQCPDEDSRDAVMSALHGNLNRERRLLAYVNNLSRTRVIAYGSVRKVNESGSTDLIVDIESGDSIWQAERSTLVRKTFSNSRDQALWVPVPGNLDVSPSIRLTPLSQRTTKTAYAGWSKRRRYIITNNSDQPLYRYPVRIGISDTAALVTAGKALASGNDLRVLINGVEQARTLVTWNTASSFVWILIPALLQGDSMVVEVLYGNAAAGVAPVLEYPDAPAFDLATSSNGSWTYLTDDIAGNAGKGAWGLTKGTEGGIANFSIPGAWQPASTLENPDSTDRRLQVRATEYVATGTWFRAAFDAWLGPDDSTVVTATNPFDGVVLENPLGIESINAGFGWTNINGFSSLVVLARDSASEGWSRILTHVAVAATDTAVAAATYTPTGGAKVKQIACAVWPDNFAQILPAAIATDYARAYWNTNVTVGIDASKIDITIGETALSDWNPTFLGGTVRAWYQADKITGYVTGQAVTTWPDTSGNAYHATGSSGPIYRTNRLNGLPGIEFNGSTQYFYNTVLSAGSMDETVFAVVDLDTAAARHAVVGSYAGNGRVMVIDTNRTLTYHRQGVGDQFASTTAITLDQDSIVGMTSRAGAGQSQSRVNGISEAETITTVPGAGGTFLGVTNSGYYWDGDIHEILITSALSDADAERVEGYLAHKWGITARLPGGHPYKTVQPAGVASTTETDIYELASEVRIGGGDPATAPYHTLLVGNARQQVGAGTPRVTLQLSETLLIDGGDHTGEIWLADLTSRIEAVSAHTIRSREGWYNIDETVESPDADWMPLSPHRPTMPNAGFDQDIGGWEAELDTPGMTVVRAHDPTWGGEVLGSLKMQVTLNTAGIGARARTIGPSVFDVADRESVNVAATFKTTNVNLVPRLYVVFLDEDGVRIGEPVQAMWTPTTADTPRRMMSARVPNRAIQYRLGVEVYAVTAGATGTVYVDDVRPNDNDLYFKDESTGSVELAVALNALIL